MNSRHFIIGTAGHIDHGKSTLVEALTGTDPDRLPEEKQRGVTIELGFAHFSLPVPGAPRETFELGMVDVPGHADFVNNMVAGVGAIDLALFIVAADDSWMPQSEEHLQILTYLGIRKFIIALTKADLVEDLEFVTELLRDDLRGTVLEEAPLVPVSAIAELGMPELREMIAQILSETPPPRDYGQARIAVDRAFSPKGIGTVITGSLTGGRLAVGTQMTAYPVGLKGKVRTIQNHNSSVEVALPGMRTALNLPDLPLKSKGRKGIARGQLLVAGITGEASLEVDVEISRSDRAIPGQRGCKRAIKSNQRLFVHHGSGRSQARVILPEGTAIRPGETGLAQLRFETGVHAMVGERFVLRDLSGEATLAGAIVLDPHPDRRHFRDDERQEFLMARAEDPFDLAMLLRTRFQRDFFLTHKQVGQALPFSTEEVKAALKKMMKAGEVISLDQDHLAEGPKWKELVKKASSAVQDYHRQHPDHPGMSTEVLKKHLGRDLAAAGCYECLLSFLGNKNFKVGENLIAHQSHSLELPPELESAASEILRLLDQAGLNPPLPTTLQTSDRHRAAYQFLTRTRQVIPLDAKVALSGKTYQEALDRVRIFLTKQGQATASEIRQELETSRKVIMPLLERFDRDLITVRAGDFRSLK